MLAIIFPPIDPVLLHVGPLSIRWYALAYIAGVLLGWWLAGRIIKKQPHIMTRAQIEDLVSWVLIGIVAGGRLGYVLFYKPSEYFSNPLEILRLWEGGMSFHGGMLGVIAAVFLFTRKYGIAFWPVMDLAALCAPIGLFLGRIANFVNGELYGRVTDIPWGVIFPYSDGQPRHPSQLYEATSEGMLLFLVLLLLAHRQDTWRRPGLISGIFLLGYWASRSICEQFREPDDFLGFVLGPFTQGQLLSFPMLLLGAYLVGHSLKKRVPA